MYVEIRGVARTVVMCRHSNETVGFTEAHSAEWSRCKRGSPPPSVGGGRSRGHVEFKRYQLKFSLFCTTYYLFVV